ncbi:MAG: DNA adenine methylase [Anaerolineae bacterium]
MVDAHPFVKWAGGKGGLLSQFDPHFPADFGQYVEPFVGSGAVFFHLYNEGRLADSHVVLIDRIEELVNCYRVIQSEVEALIAALHEHAPQGLDAEYYYAVRDWDRQPDYAARSNVERAARFIYLNRVCYNGLYRVNRKGQFNVPLGRYRNPTICDEPNLWAVHQALHGVELQVGDFSLCLPMLEEGDLAYFDPPYHPLSDTANFTSYTPDGFGVAAQQRLAEVIRTLDRRGCRIMLSNSDTELIRRLYRRYVHIPIRATRAINSKAGGRGPIQELLIMNEG